MPMSPKESEGVSATGVDAMEEDKKHIPLSNNSQNELKSKKTSIDVTKALMLLGFASWSAFEQGISIIMLIQISCICDIIDV